MLMSKMMLRVQTTRNLGRDRMGKTSWANTQLVWDSNPGLPVLKEGTAAVIDALRSAGALLAEEKYAHKYPYDWRTKLPTIFRATDQVYFASPTHPCPSPPQLAHKPVPLHLLHICLIYPPCTPFPTWHCRMACRRGLSWRRHVDVVCPCVHAHVREQGQGFEEGAAAVSQRDGYPRRQRSVQSEGEG